MKLLSQLAFVTFIAGVLMTLGDEGYYHQSPQAKPPMVCVEKKSCAQPQTGAPVLELINEIGQELARNITENHAITLTKSNFTAFVRQDLLYLLNYRSWVGRLSSQCKATPCQKLFASAVLGRLPDTNDIVHYKNHFDIKDDNITASPALQAYEAFYERQTSCVSAVSSMLVCLCSYGHISEGIQNFLDHFNMTNPLPEDYDASLLKAFVEYNAPRHNASLAGTSCSYAQEILQQMDNGGGVPVDQTVAREAFGYEKRLWNLR